MNIEIRNGKCYRLVPEEYLTEQERSIMRHYNHEQREREYHEARMKALQESQKAEDLSNRDLFIQMLAVAQHYPSIKLNATADLDGNVFDIVIENGSVRMYNKQQAADDVVINEDRFPAAPKYKDGDTLIFMFNGKMIRGIASCPRFMDVDYFYTIKCSDGEEYDIAECEILQCDE